MITTMKTPQQSHYHNLPYLGCAHDYLDEISENIDDFSVLKQFTIDELTVLSRYLQCYAAPRGYYLYEQGQPADHLIIVLSGEVKIAHLDTPALSKNCSAGVTLGSEMFAEGHHWEASCITTQPADFAVLDQHGFNQMLMHSPRLANQFLLAMMQAIVGTIHATAQQSISKESILLS